MWSRHKRQLFSQILDWQRCCDGICSLWSPCEGQISQLEGGWIVQGWWRRYLSDPFLNTAKVLPHLCNNGSKSDKFFIKVGGWRDDNYQTNSSGNKRWAAQRVPLKLAAADVCSKIGQNENEILCLYPHHSADVQSPGKGYTHGCSSSSYRTCKIIYNDI